jgi:hypothetical protein
VSGNVTDHDHDHDHDYDDGSVGIVAGERRAASLRERGRRSFPTTK